MSTADRAGFENAISEYRNRLSNIKADELQAYARRVAESDKPLEELKSVVGEVTSPLALDFLKEGIMHHMGVASAQIKKGGAALRKDLEKQFNDRLSQLKTKAQGVIDEQRGRLQGALDEARGRAQGAVDEARGAVDQARGNATEAFANARDQANALNPTNTNPNATNDEQGNSAQQRIAEDEDEEPTGFGAEEDEDEEPTGFGAEEDEDEEPTGFGAEEEDEDEDEEPTGFGAEDEDEAPTRALPESEDIDAIETRGDVRSVNTALKDRYNNLTDEAQQRVSDKYAADEGTVARGEGEGPNGVRSIDDMKINLGTMQEAIEDEEKAGNFKPTQAPEEDEDLPTGNAPTSADVEPARRAATTADDDDDTPLSLQEPRQVAQETVTQRPPPALSEQQAAGRGDVEEAFRDHVDSRVQQLRSKLDADPELSVKIAGNDQGTSIGTGLAKGQHTAYAEQTGGEDVGDKVQQYISEKMDDLKADYPDRVSFGRVGGDIPENEIHVWGANAQNVNLPAGTTIDGTGQASDIATAGENEFGIVSTPLKGVPTPAGPPQGAVAQRVAQIEQQGDELRPTQQLPTGQRRPQPQDEEDEIRPAPTQTQDQRPAGGEEDEEEVTGFGDDAEAAAETGGKAAGRLGAAIGGEGAELGEDAAIAAASGAETGGLGFLVAGVLGIGATLASIFAPHHDPKPPTSLGPVAAPTQTVGLR